jgi:NTE family protein
VNRTLKILVIIILVFNSRLSLYSQPVNIRPKVGLALSGGGSLGMAHVGVLKVMEEAGLQPDYITGVSMGSIVGSMYSIGYRADSLAWLFKTAEWNIILSNNLPENKVIYTEKKYFNNSIISFPVSSKKVRLPSGLITGQQIEKMLSYYIWPAADIEDFSKLPIPFLCIGTDLISCKKVVLRKGYLPDAIRASMAVPSIFTPLKIDTAILIDGGFVRNIAVSELKEMGADIVIGSYTGFHKYNENELQSVSGVLKQLSFFNSVNDYTEQKKLIDILIEPHVKDLSATVFTNADSIIQRGYKAALPFKEKFKKLADSLDLIGPGKPAESILGRHSLKFDRIDIIGNDIISDDQILGVLDIKPGTLIDRNLLSDRIDLLYGRSWFEKVKYRVIPRHDSLTLVIDCIEKPQAMIYGSVHYDSFLKAGVLLELSARNILTHRSLMDFETYLGQFYKIKADYTQFIDRNQILGLSAFFNTDNTPIPVLKLRDEIGQFISRNYCTGLELNKRNGLNNLMSLSAAYESMNMIPDFIPTNHLKRISFNYLTTNYLNQINTLDTKHFPNKGLLLQFSLGTSRLLSGKFLNDKIKRTYTRENPGDFLFKRSFSAMFDMKRYFSPGRKFTMAIATDIFLTYTNDSITSPHNYYFAGGPDFTFAKSIPLTGFHPGEIAVDRFAGLRFETDLEFQHDLHLNMILNAAVGREPDEVSDYSFLGGYGFGVGYMSIIGPLKIGIMQGFSTHERYFHSVKGYLSIGFSF